MTFAIETIAYKEDRFLPIFLKYYKDLVDYILVLNSTDPYYSNREEGVRVKSYGLDGYWETEQDQRNDGLRLLNHYDWVFILDPDEFIKVEDFENIKKFLSSASYPAYKVPEQYTYWKKGYRIDPPEPYRQLIAVKSNTETKFMDKRGINKDVLRIPINFVLHHFSMARTDEEVLRKMTSYSHSKDFDGKKWYEEKWLKWTPEMVDFHPANPRDWHQAVETNIPEEFNALWEGL